MSGRVGADPFGTAALRRSVLDGWASSPTRLREDTAAERDLARGGYRDRLLAELAQNAADAARRAGVPGRLRVELDPGTGGAGVLRVANTGAPLDAAGVAGLASLRASGKTGDGSVGRYGVGSTAVLAVTDEPTVRSTTGGVSFSAARTRAVAGVPDGAAVPVLRLPFPAAGRPPAGWDTEVVLPLRADVDGAALLAVLAAQAEELLLELPGLVEVSVGALVRRVEPAGAALVVTGGPGGPRTWLRATAGPATWLVEHGDAGVVPTGPDVLRAPTRTDEELDLPARLVLDVALAPDRRRLLPGPTGPAALAAAAVAYPGLLAQVAPAERTRLVPRPGFPRSPVDADLRDGVLAALRAAAWLPAARGADVAPADAVVLDEASAELVALLADVVPGLLAAELSAGAHTRALAALGVARLGPAGLADALAGVQRAPAWWHRVYAGLDALPGTAQHRAELASLPVPLADGRTVLGPRSAVVLDAGGVAAATRTLPGLRVVHPDAVHPLLTGLGARTVGAGELLADELVAGAVAAVDEDDPAAAEVAEVVLGLLAAAGPTAEPPSWVGGLLLPDADGGLRPADELLLPGAPLAAVLAPDAPLGTVDPVLAARHGPDVLRAAGVGWGFAVVRDEDPAGPDHDLDDEEAWWDAAAAPERVLAVRDLDLVDPDRWPAALALLAGDRDTLEAARLPGGHTPWWLARHARLDGAAPGTLRAADDPTLAGLLDPVPAAHATVLAAALADPGAGDPRTAALLLDRLADPGRRPTAAAAARVHGLLAAAVAAGGLDPADVEPPDRVRTAAGDAVPADRGVVLDRAWLAPLLAPGRTVLTTGHPDALAELLDVPLATDELAGAAVEGGGTVQPWEQDPAAVAVCAALGVPVPAGVVHRHDTLRVDGPDGPVEVPWWVEPDGTGHAGPGGATALLVHVVTVDTRGAPA